MTKAFYISGIILISLILICCDPAIRYKYYVHNKSDKKIQIEYHRYYEDSLVTILPKSEVIIADFPARGSNPHDEGQRFLREFNQIYYIPNDSFKITKDILDRKNWSYDKDTKYFGIIRVGTNKYYLDIDTNDIELINER